MASAAGTIGVVGGGQLALMLCEAAQSRDVDVVVQSASDHDPAMAVAREQVSGAPTDAVATEELSKRCQHITFEKLDSLLCFFVQTLCQFAPAPFQNFLIKINTNGGSSGIRFGPSG